MHAVNWLENNVWDHGEKMGFLTCVYPIEESLLGVVERGQYLEKRRRPLFPWYYKKNANILKQIRIIG